VNRRDRHFVLFTVGVVSRLSVVEELFNVEFHEGDEYTSLDCWMEALILKGVMLAINSTAEE